MEVFFELQGLTAASGTCQMLTTMLSFCPTRMFEDFNRDTLDKSLMLALATARGRHEGLD